MTARLRGQILGVAIAVGLIAALTVLLNAQSHEHATLAEYGLWLGVGVAYGVLVMGGILAIALPLAWLGRRLKPPGE